MGSVKILKPANFWDNLAVPNFGVLTFGITSSCFSQLDMILHSLRFPLQNPGSDSLRSDMGRGGPGV